VYNSHRILTFLDTYRSLMVFVVVYISPEPRTSEWEYYYRRSPRINKSKIQLSIEKKKSWLLNNFVPCIFYHLIIFKCSLTIYAYVLYVIRIYYIDVYLWHSVENPERFAFEHFVKKFTVSKNLYFHSRHHPVRIIK